ncbi:MAG: hydroxyacid dehydrogenase [Tepidisphaerales bacterium]
MGEKPRAVFVSSAGGGASALFDAVYPPALRRRLRVVCELEETICGGGGVEVAADVQWVFSTWGMPAWSAPTLERLPALRAVFYAAGSVQHFARPLLERGVTVVSAWAANALPVAEYVLGQVLLACRRAWPAALRLREQKSPAAWHTEGAAGSYGAKVALVALGMVGRRVAELLRPFDLEVIGYDPYVSDDVLSALRVRRASLEECFETADVVSLHLPKLPSTRGMIGRELLRRMKPYATLINTARGEVLDAEALFAVLRERADLTAVVDVTDPAEPPPEGSPYYALQNLVLTPHLAGTLGNERARLGLYVVEEAERLARGEPLRYGVTLKMLETMA